MMRAGGLALALALGLAVAWAAPAAAEPQSLPIPLYATQPGRVPHLVDITVAGGRPIPVSFDTGSVGLYVMERDVGPEVERTAAPIHQGYVDGTRFEGYVGLATVAFPGAGVSTRERVAVGVITRVFCAAERPNCPGSDSKPGVMGVGLATGGRLISPLAQLPGNLRSGFVVDARPGVRPHVTLGLTPEEVRDFRFVPLTPEAAGPAGLPSWDSGSVRGCYAVNGRDTACQPVIFDTGQTNSVFDGGSLSGMRLGPHGYLLPGQRFALSIPGAMQLSIVTDRSMYIMPKQTPRSNIGQLIYRYAAIVFDARQGRIGFLH